MNQGQNEHFSSFTAVGNSYLYYSGTGAIYQVPGIIARVALFPLLSPGAEIAIKNNLHGEYEPEQISEAVKSLRGMINRGEKESSDSVEVPGADLLLKELHLQISHDCNFNCSYCYAGGGDFGGPARLMEQEMADKALDFFVAHLAPGAVGDLSFDGGEPFLNWPLIEYVIQRAEDKLKHSDKRLFFNISTNGSLFSANTNEFARKKRIVMGVSIDGEQQAHDCCRTFRDGSGSYETVAGNVQALLAVSPGHNLQGRVTITRGNMDILKTVQHLLSLGFRHIYLEPVSGEAPWIFTDEELETIEQGFGDLARFYTAQLLSGRFFILRNFYIFLKRLHFKQKMVHKCGVGRTGLAVTPGGDIFPCYKFCSMPEYKMGHIEDGVLDPEVQKRFIQNHVDSRPGCNQCWARYLCGGGCAFLGALKHRDAAQTDRDECRINRLLARLSLEIYTTVKTTDPNLWSVFFNSKQS